ncbi:MAG: hypothetical protein O3B74_12885 [Proteobacteria bacterium]|nr:hypothetical protein [Pseudomonadota bacterium]
MLNDANKARTPWRSVVIAILTGWCFAAPALAGKADVVGVQAVRDSDGSYRFKVSVRHNDQGWEHYANSWEVVAPDGAVLGTRVLLHPHEQEQPFARYLSKVIIPDGIAEVTIRAIDIKHGGGGKHMTVKVPR